MKKNLLICLLLFSFSTVFGQMEEFFWAKQLEGVSFDVPIQLEQKSNSHLVSVGYFRDSVDLDPGPGVVAYYAATSGTDLFFQILDTNGNYINGGAIQNVNGGAFIPFDMKLSKNDEIYLTGWINGNYDMDPGPGISIGSSTNFFSTAIVKLNSDLSLGWYKIIQNNNVQAAQNIPYHINLDDSSYAYISGAFMGVVDFDQGSGQYIDSTSAVWNSYVLKYDQSGNLLNLFHLESESANFITATAIDKDSNFCIFGGYLDSLDIDTGTGVDMRYAKDTNALFQLKLDPNFNTIWANTYDGGRQNATLLDKISIDSDNNWYSTFAFEDSITIMFNNTPQTYYVDGTRDQLILKIDENGNNLWAYQLKTKGTNNLINLTMDNKNSFFLYGFFSDSIDLDFGPNQDIHYDSLSTAFIVHFDSSGNQLGSSVFSGGLSGIYDLLIDGSRSYALGIFNGTLDTDPNSGVSNLTSTSTDGFLIKLGSCSPEITVEQVQSCTSYTWIDGKTYSSTSNNGQMVYQGSSGCDSIIKLEFTYTPDYAVDTIVSCSAITWIDGNTYSDDDTSAVFVTTGANGCDSVINLYFTHIPETDVEVIASCQSSYTWRDGITYTSNNNTAVYTFSSQNGCDSTLYLDLSFYTPSGTDVISTCEPYTWIDGNTYTSNNNSATYTLTNAQGCDSIVTLNLTFNQPSSSTAVVRACQTYTWIDGNTYTSSNNTATYTLTNAEGCDSTITLDLTIGQPESSTDEIEACNSYTWIDGITYTSSNNTATHTLQTQYGCDSIVSLDLTIDHVNTNVTRINKTLSCDQFNASYQWIDCHTMQEIPGATNQSYTAPDSGSYACIITTIDCFDTTDCFDFASLGFDDLSTIDFKLFPNPNNGTFTVDFGQHIDQGDIRILSMDGKLVKVLNFESKSNLTISFEAEPGVYWFEMSSAYGIQRARIIRR